jgi:hypothetical protein
MVRSAGGDSHAAIAQQMGISEAAARQIIHRARATLRAAVHAVLPPPVLWLARRAGALAERLPSPPPSIEQFVPKIAAVAAAATAVAAPASLIHASGQGSPHPAGSNLSSPMSMTADRTALNIDVSRPQAITWLPGAPTARSGGGSPLPPRVAASSTGRWIAQGSPSSGAAATNSNQPGGSATTSSNATTADPLASYPSASDASAAGPSAADPSATGPSATGPSTTDPSATDPSAATPSVTDPTGPPPGAVTTDPTGTAPTSTDPTSTDPSSSLP